MILNKDILIYHIFPKLSLESLGRLRQINKELEAIIDKEFITSRILQCINNIWIFSFKQDVHKFKDLLVKYNCTILWNVIGGNNDICELRIKILASCLKGEAVDCSNNFDRFVCTYKYLLNFQERYSAGSVKRLDGYYVRRGRTYNINSVWFRNSLEMDRYLFKHEILATKNSYSICSETGKEIIIMPSWL